MFQQPSYCLRNVLMQVFISFLATIGMAIPDPNHASSVSGGLPSNLLVTQKISLLITPALLAECHSGSQSVGHRQKSKLNKQLIWLLGACTCWEVRSARFEQPHSCQNVSWGCCSTRPLSNGKQVAAPAQCQRCKCMSATWWEYAWHSVYTLSQGWESVYYVKGTGIKPVVRHPVADPRKSKQIMGVTRKENSIKALPPLMNP